MSSAQKLLEVQNLSIGIDGKQPVSITDRVGFSMGEGEVLGLVGESGCGKSVTAMSILNLLPSPGGVVDGGKILFEGRDVLSMSNREISRFRGRDVSMIFQEPSAAMNPLMRIGKQMEECFENHSYKGSIQTRIRELLEKVGFPDPDRILNAFPHELSGGMLQRIMIAMALLLKPRLLLADEPTTAVDVTVQTQIMELLLELQLESGTSILLITHNLNLIAQYAQRVAIMYAGRIVEESTVREFVQNPCHPYSRGLLKALPSSSKKSEQLIPIPGSVPSPKDFKPGCRFSDRCPHAFDACIQRPAYFFPRENHRVACFLYDKNSDPDQKSQEISGRIKKQAPFVPGDTDGVMGERPLSGGLPSQGGVPENPPGEVGTEGKKQKKKPGKHEEDL